MMLTLGYVYAKLNHLPDEIAVIAERRDGQWWCCSPGKWDERGPVWVPCEMVVNVKREAA